MKKANNTLLLIKATLGCFFVLAVFLINCWSHYQEYLNPRLPAVSRLIDRVKSSLFLEEYAFFSPDITDGYVVAYFIKDEKSRHYKAQYLQFTGAETTNKLTSLVHKVYYFNDCRALFTQSMATYYFQNNPEQSETTFVLYLYKLPTIEMYAKGKQPKLDPVYVQKFSRIL